MFLDNYKNVLFDLDGTLIDTGEGIINSVFYCVEKMQLKQIDYEEARLFVGPPLIDSFVKLFDIDFSLASECVKVFREYYKEKGKKECIPYFGIKKVLAYLKMKKYRIFVATSKPTVFAKEILEQHGLDDFFESVEGSNIDNSRCKKEDIISDILLKFDLINSDTIMIGDKAVDILAARKCNIDSIGVLYGYGSYEEISDAKPLRIVENVTELLK